MLLQGRKLNSLMFELHTCIVHMKFCYIFSDVIYFLD